MGHCYSQHSTIFHIAFSHNSDENKSNKNHVSISTNAACTLYSNIPYTLLLLSISLLLTLSFWSGKGKKYELLQHIMNYSAILWLFFSSLQSKISIYENLKIVGITGTHRQKAKKRNREREKEKGMENNTKYSLLHVQIPRVLRHQYKFHPLLCYD